MLELRFLSDIFESLSCQMPIAKLKIWPFLNKKIQWTDSDAERK